MKRNLCCTFSINWGIGMETEVMAAMITFAGILVFSKMINYQLSRLKERVNKYNSIIERAFILEEKTRAANYRISNLEEKTKR